MRGGPASGRGRRRARPARVDAVEFAGFRERVDGGGAQGGRRGEGSTERRHRPTPRPGAAASHAGAIAFSRTGDPDSGNFQNAVVTAEFGEVGKGSM